MAGKPAQIFEQMLGLHNHHHINQHINQDITVSFSRFPDINKNPYNLETLTFIYHSSITGNNFFVSQDNMQKMSNAFDSLDKDQNGTLDHQDFQDRNPTLHHRYQQLWIEIQKRMDINTDGNISKFEFLAFFIVLTLETDQCRMTTTGVFAQDLKDWRDAFNRQIGVLIDQFLTFSTNILTGSPIKG